LIQKSAELNASRLALVLVVLMRYYAAFLWIFMQ